jgi:hypothetical protein
MALTKDDCSQNQLIWSFIVQYRQYVKTAAHATGQNYMSLD